MRERAILIDGVWHRFVFATVGHYWALCNTRIPKDEGSIHFQQVTCIECLGLAET